MATQKKPDARGRTAKAARIATDPTPVYAALGLSDLIVERLRVLGEQAVQLGQETGRQMHPDKVAQSLKDSAEELNAHVTKLLQELSEQVQGAPGAMAGEAGQQLRSIERSYAELAERGEKLVERIRTQQPTQELVAQVGDVVKQGRGLISAARKGAQGTAATAQQTVAAARTEAADVVADAVAGEDVMVTPAAEASSTSAATRTAAPRKRPARAASAESGTARKTAAKRTAAKATATKRSAAKATAAKATPAKATPAKAPAAKVTGVADTEKPSGTARKTAAKATAARATTGQDSAGTAAAKSALAKEAPAQPTTAKQTAARTTAAKTTPAQTTSQDAGNQPARQDQDAPAAAGEVQSAAAQQEKSGD